MPTQQENADVGDFKCEQCDLPELDFFDAMEDTTSTGSLKSKMFVYIIKQKDCLINELRDKIINK